MGAVWVLKAAVESILMGFAVDKGTTLSLKAVDHFSALPTVQRVRTSCIQLYSRRTPAVIKDSLAYVNREVRTFHSLCILMFRCIWGRLFSICPLAIQRSTESLYKSIGGNPSPALITSLLHVANLLYGGNSGDMMRAPGRPGQFVKRAVFEADPKTYFRKLRGKP